MSENLLEMVESLLGEDPAIVRKALENLSRQDLVQIAGALLAKLWAEREAHRFVDGNSGVH